MRFLPAIAMAASILGVFVLLTSRVSAPHRSVMRALAVVVFFVWLNLINFCQPGWCADYGLPFHYFEWSDAIVYMNGVRTSPAGFKPVAFALDALLAVALFVTVLKIDRRRASKAEAASPGSNPQSRNP